MRAIYFVPLLAACCALSCTRQGVECHEAGPLSNAEKQDAAAVHPELSGWWPHYSAEWDKQGVFRHVRLQADGGSIVWPHTLTAILSLRPLFVISATRNGTTPGAALLRNM